MGLSDTKFICKKDKQQSPTVELYSIYYSKLMEKEKNGFNIIHFIGFYEHQMR